MAKSRQLKIYAVDQAASVFIRSTVNKKGRFVLRSDKYGKALSSKVSDAELGQWVRRILKYCR